MRPDDILFTVHAYDKDGNCYDRGVFLHFEGASVKAADSIDEFNDFVEHMKKMHADMVSYRADLE